MKIRISCGFDFKSAFKVKRESIFLIILMIHLKSAIKKIKKNMSAFKIISTNELLVNLENPDLKIFDVSTLLVPSASGVGYDIRELKQNWVESRILNSEYLDVNRYLSEPTNAVNYGVPGERKIIDFILEHNLGYEDRIILYERSPSIWAPRVWWILTYY